MGPRRVHVGRIPHSTTATELIECLERAVGKGTVKTVNIHTNQQTIQSKGFGFVTFNNEQAAERAAMLGENGHLVLLNNVLRVSLTDHSIVHRPNHTLSTSENGKLYLSCLVSEGTASWQWSSSSNVSTEFDFTSRKLRFALHVGSNLEKREYKLECEFEEISSIRLVAIQGLPTRALSVQEYSTLFQRLESNRWVGMAITHPTILSHQWSYKISSVILLQLFQTLNKAQDVEKCWKIIYAVKGFYHIKINNWCPQYQCYAFVLRSPPHIYLHKSIKGRIRDLVAEMFSIVTAIDPFYIQTEEEEEELWVRATDFTPKKSIGQCLVYIFELPSTTAAADLNDLFKKLADYELASYPPLIQGLILQKGASFATSQVLVPIVHTPPGITVNFELMYKVNQLVQTSKLSGPTLDHSFYNLLQSHATPLEHVKLILDKIGQSADLCLEPAKYVEAELEKLRESDSGATNSIKLAEGLTWVRRVLVTPTRLYCMGPEVDTSNRVTRHFVNHLDRFLRVSFVDENKEPMLSTALSVPTKGGAQAGIEAERSEVYGRILKVLKEGITIGSQKYEFLAFSSSQLREQSVWMFSSDGSLTADSIRAWMGDFLNFRNVAKCAARMGQCFSSSTPTLEVQPHEVEEIPDIEREDEFGLSTYCFSDGIGKISKEFAGEVAKKYRVEKLQTGIIPSAYQIRYGGYKGVVAVDPNSQFKLSLRPSMRKFASKHVGLDVLNTSRFLPSYLNRQIISLLSTLGVEDKMFEEMQSRVVSELDDMLKDADVAREVLQVNHSGDSHVRLTALLAAGYHPQREPYVRLLLQTFRASQLLDLRKRTRILVPKGRVLMGCLDEENKLSYGEIFLQVTPAAGNGKWVDDGLSSFTKHPVSPRDNELVAHVVTGWVVVAKNPCLHPGDIRRLKAVDVPGLRHMVDCLVFPQNGQRPHPNECSGSDLDGDLYFVSWDDMLIPPTVDEPMDYCSPGAAKLDHDVRIEEIQEFFVKYMVNDSLGLISNAHVVHADSEPEMARSAKCQELAKLVSIAVDFPKTGVPAVIPQNLRPKCYPDFMEKGDKMTYRSERVLGKLFRLVKEASNQKLPTKVTKGEMIQAFDKDLTVEGFEDYLDKAKFHKNMYDRKLIGLMNQYGVETEAEAVTGNILVLARQHQKKKGDVIERIRDAVSSLIDEARLWFETNIDEHSGSEDDMYAKASAWYHVTYHLDHFQPFEVGKREVHLLSFPWAIHEVLLQIKEACGRPQEKKRKPVFNGNTSKKPIVL